MAADLKYLMRKQSELESIRRLRESEWQQIARYFLPTKNFLIELLKGQSLPRYVQTSVPQKALLRCAWMLVGYLIDPTRPFIVPNVTQGLVNAGRHLKLSSESADYLDDMSYMIFDRMTNARSGFTASLMRLALELLAFGNGVMWTGRKRGFGPIYMNRPIRQCWFDVSNEDVVNWLHYGFKLKVWEIRERWPDGFNRSECLRKIAAEPGGENKDVKLLHCVYPRKAGEKGGVATNKPFAEVIFIYGETDDEPLMEGGYDDFPFAVPRMRVAEGNPYGQGLAWIALPPAIVLNRMLELVEYGVGSHVAPPMFMPARLLPGKLDRRLGAPNYYDPKLLGFQSLKDAIQYLPAGGDVGIGTDYMKMLAGEIEDAFMIDWMKLPEHSGMTATEINDRRQLRAIGMTGFLPDIERSLMDVVGDRTLDIMVEENMLPPPPDQLRGIEVEWDYAGPLAMAQKQGFVDSYQRLLNLSQMAATVSPTGADGMAFDAGLRLAAESLGLPPEVLRSRAEMDQRRAQEQQQQQAQAEAEQAATAAAAMRDGGQAIQSLAGANGMQKAA